MCARVAADPLLAVELGIPIALAVAQFFSLPVAPQGSMNKPRSVSPGAHVGDLITGKMHDHVT